MPIAKKKASVTKRPPTKKPAAKKAVPAKSGMDVLKLFLETYSRF